MEYQRRAIICKPHGSLDWYIRGNKPISFCAHATNLDRLIIVPGRNKLEAGYNSPFDFHREKANYHIDNASRFLIIGYGFNDAHLETHLKKAIEGGKSTIMLTHTLSENALNIAFNNSNVIAIDHYCDEHTEGSRFIIDKADYNFPGMQIWDLGNFITEVLEA